MAGQTVSELTELRGPAVTLADELESLVPVALTGLGQMQDSPTGLFSHKARLGPGGEFTNHGTNPLYTAASAVGLLAFGTRCSNMS